MKGIFDGVVVVDLSNNVAGPNATAMLADYGAEIIKIEKPVIGDDNRAYGPFLEGKGVIAMGLNRNKKSIVLDTRKPDALDVLRRLIEKADVVVETFRPGYMKKIGFGYEDIIKIKPDIIMCSVSGYGQTGPWGDRPGYDLMIQAASGLMNATGYADASPSKVGFAVGDFCTSLTVFGALASALYHKSKTGEGQYIDVCLFESLINILDFTDVAYNNMPVPPRSGAHHATLAPFGLFKGTDGYVMIGAVSEKLWASLCKLMNKEELINDPEYQGSG
jgi:crotonobetainyl-CoA:carnitine CoA-transferase CaiB-like acyl-CoA transferase